MRTRPPSCALRGSPLFHTLGKSIFTRTNPTTVTTPTPVIASRIEPTLTTSPPMPVMAPKTMNLGTMRNPTTSSTTPRSTMTSMRLSRTTLRLIASAAKPETAANLTSLRSPKILRPGEIPKLWRSARPRRTPRQRRVPEPKGASHPEEARKTRGASKRLRAGKTLKAGRALRAGKARLAPKRRSIPRAAMRGEHVGSNPRGAVRRRAL